MRISDWSSDVCFPIFPAKFKEDRVSVLHDAIRQAGIATLVTLGPDGLIASHLPMMIDPEPAPYSTLIGPFSRGNPQWRDILPDVQALAFFTEPNAYIPPGWSPTPPHTGQTQERKTGLRRHEWTR